MKLRYILSIFQLMRIPGFLRVFKDLESTLRFQFFNAALDSGLLNELGTPQKRKDLIEKLDVKRPELLDALLDVGVSIGEISVNRDEYRLKGSVSKSLVSEKGGALGALIQAHVTYYNRAYREFSDRVKGGPLSDDLEKIGDLVAKVSKIQEPFISDFIKYSVDNKKEIRLLEIGCGSGTHMKTAFEINNMVSGIGLDCDDEVVQQAQDNMEKWGLSNQFKILKGDIRTFDPGQYGTFDLITMYNIIYYFEAGERLDLIKKLKENLSPGGKIAVVNLFQAKNKDMAAATLNFVNSSLEGITPLPELSSLKKLFKDSGFQNIKSTKIIPGASLYSIIAELI